MQEYKCPCCGGSLAFDSTVQKMKCPFCDTEFEMETLQNYDAELQKEQPDQMKWETTAGKNGKQAKWKVFDHLSVTPVGEKSSQTLIRVRQPVHFAGRRS